MDRLLAVGLVVVLGISISANAWLFRQLAIVRDQTDRSHLKVKQALAFTPGTANNNSPSVPSNPLNARAFKINCPLVNDPNWTNLIMTKQSTVTERIAGMKSEMPDLGAKLALDDAAVDRLLAIQLDALSQPNVDPKALLNEKLSSEFGSDVAQKYENYEYAQAGNSATSAILRAFTDAGVPLSKEQSEQLADLYATTLSNWNPVARAPDPQNISMQDVLEQMNQNDQFVLSSANSFLTEQQVSVLQQSQENALKKKQAILGL